MTEKRVKRKLSAILSADVEGYSRLMGDDEVSTVRTLESYRNVMSDLIDQFRGRVVDSPGDNLLAEFSSVVDAVQCAVEIHEVIRAKNEELPENRKMLFRIGVNLGDVIEEGERIYGDGVNIAARLEGLAEPGGVCISGSAYEQIKNKLALGYVYIGEHSVKNIAEPLKVYKVPMGVKVVAPEEKKEKKSKLKKEPTTLSTKKETGWSLLRHIISWIAVIILVAVTGGLIIVGMSIWKSEPKETLSISRFDYKLPENQILLNAYQSLTISPDGRRIVYSTTEGLYLRSLENLEARLIHGSDNPVGPFFSPDSQWVGYESLKDRQLKKISINGGAPVSICDAGNKIGSASWGEDNKIVFGTGAGVMRVSADGGDPELLIKNEGDYFVSPEILPGGEALIVTLLFSKKLILQSLKSDERSELFSGIAANYIHTGHLVYWFDSSLYAVQFNLDMLKVTGGPVSVVNGVAISQYNSEPQYGISDSGTLIFISGHKPSQAQLEWFDRNGNKLGTVGEPAFYEQFSLSPDEKKVVIEQYSSNNFDLWVLELDRNGVGSPITFESSNERDHIWAPDGDSIAFNANKNNEPDDLFKFSLTTEEEVVLFSEPDKRLVAEDWSMDGRYIAYNSEAVEERGIWLLPLFDEQPRPVVKGKFAYDEPKFSPDGKWLAYISTEAGDWEVFIMPLEGEGEKHRISTRGGGQPQWKKDMKELYYLALDGWIMSVELNGEPLVPDDPKRLFQTNISAVYPGTDQYAVTSDGERFLFLTQEKEEQDQCIYITLNWFEELKQRVPVD